MKKSHKVRDYCPRILVISSLIVGVAPVSPAFSQAVLEEVIVTARKREESLQDTPVAVSAFSGADLIAAGIDNLADLQKVVPNIDVSNGNGQSGAASIFIRGVGARNTGVNFDSGVGIYLDDVYISRPDGALFDNTDIQSVQVLRGPQGTLFGKNTTAGAVLYATNRPSDELEGSVTTRLGNYDRRDLKAVINVPLIADSLATRLSVSTVNRDGYTENKLSGEKLNDEDRVGATWQLQWLPSDAVTTNLNLNWSDTDQKIRGLKCMIPPDVAGSGWQNALLDDAVIIPSTGKGIQEHCQDAARRDRDEVLLDDHPLKYKATTKGASFNVEWALADTMALKSVTAWRQTEAGESGDVDASAIPLLSRTNFSFPTNENRVTDQYSQEFQLSGDFAEGELSYVAGLFYFKEKTTKGTISSALGPFFNTAYIPNLATFRNPAIESLTDNESYSGFSQVDWNMSESWRLTGGLRYTKEKRELELNAFEPILDTLSTSIPPIDIGFDGALLFPAGPDSYNPNHLHQPVFSNSSGNVSNDDWTPMASLQYFFEDVAGIDSGNVYLTLSKGFLSGGLSETPDLVTGEMLEYDPEKVTSYELGWKLEGWDQRLRFNVALFYLDYRDRQLTSITVDPDSGALAVITTNADKASVTGLETEFLILPMDGLELTLNATFNDGKIDDFVDNRIVVPGSLPGSDCTLVTLAGGGGDVDVCTVDRSDEDLPRLPDQSYFMAAQYSWNTEWGTFIPRIQYALRKSVNNCFDRASCVSGVFKTDQKNLGARMSWVSTDAQWRVTLWGENLADDRYIEGGNPLQDYSKTVGVIYNMPRTWGVDIALDW
jgi:iron complex outermembrane receptor protein